MAADPLDEVRSLLAERARILRPDPEMIDRMVERCRSVERRAPGTSGRRAAPTVLESRPPPPPPPPPPAPAILAAGTLLGGYRIEALLGAGGMGQVYRAVQLSMNRTVALKILAPKGGMHGRMRERFIREARAAGRLHHPNLISVHDAGEENGLLFFSMEYVPGRSLRAESAARGRLDEAEALDYIRQTLNGLRYAHEHGVIHRDIKPDNIMLVRGADELSQFGRIRIADLGLSRVDPGRGPASKTELFNTMEGAMLGTPHYMAPEQARDAHAADHRADLYGVGATLYHLVCGVPPFDGPSAMAVIVAAGSVELEFPRQSPSPAVQSLIRYLMQKRPEDRPADAAAALVLVERVAGGSTLAARTASSSSAVAARAPAARGSRRWLWIAASILAIAAAGTIWGPVAAAQLAWRQQSAEILAIAATGDLPTAVAAAHLAATRSARAAEGAPGQPFASLSGAAGWAAQRADAAQELLRDLERRWDALSLPQAKPVLDAADKALAESRFGEALGMLGGIPPAQRSPAVEAEAATREKAVFEQQAKALEASRQGEENEIKLQEIRRRLAAMGEVQARQWLPQRADPPASIALRDGYVACTGAGSAMRIAPAMWERFGRAQPLVRYGVRIADGSWQLDLGDGRILSWTRLGAALSARGRPTLVLATPGEDGWCSLALLMRDDVVHVQTPSGAQIPLPGAPLRDLRFSWNLPGGAAADVRAQIDLQRPRQR